MFDHFWWIQRDAVKTATNAALHDLGAMVARMPMGVPDAVGKRRKGFLIDHNFSPWFAAIGSGVARA
jgi:hypothetical protein